MHTTRRRFVQTAGIAAAALAAASRTSEGAAQSTPSSIASLKPFAGRAVPITDDERRARIENARRLMVENGLGAIILEPGTTMNYFVNVRWGTSERPFLLVI